MNKIFITGGLGFIGANLIEKLLAKDFKVTIYDNFSSGKSEFVKSINDCQLINGDIRDYDHLKSSLKGHDAIIHLAAFGSVVDSVISPRENFDVNVVGTFNVFHSALENDITKIIFASTGGALIGNALPPVSEKSLPKPISPYGSSKLCGEAYASAFSNSYDMSLTGLRFANVIGPISAHKKGAVTSFIQSIMQNKPIQIFGDGSATRDFLYVDDLCEGIIQAFEKKLPGFNAIHLSSGREISIKHLAIKLTSIANQPNHEIIYEEKRMGEVERNFANYNLAEDLLGFQPKTNIDRALKATWDWFQNK